MIHAFCDIPDCTSLWHQWHCLFREEWGKSGRVHPGPAVRTSSRRSRVRESQDEFTEAADRNTFNKAASKDAVNNSWLLWFIMMLHATRVYAAVEESRNMLNGWYCRWNIECRWSSYAALKSVYLSMVLQVLHRLLFNMENIFEVFTASRQNKFVCRDFIVIITD